MDFSKRRCGECARVGFSKVNVKGIWNHPWKDYPVVFLLEDHFVWQCNFCHEEYAAMGEQSNVDDLIERSLRFAASKFIEIIRAKTGLKYEDIALRLGVRPEYLSTVKAMKKTPSFQFWNMLKAAASLPNDFFNIYKPDYILAEMENMRLTPKKKRA